MKIADTDILLVPGYGIHPQVTGCSVGRRKWPMPGSWNRKTGFNLIAPFGKKTLLTRMEKTTRPIVLVGHSLGCILIAHMGQKLEGKIAGAYLVAPTDLERAEPKPAFDTASFLPLPQSPLPFPTQVAASRTDAHCSFERAEAMANAWGAKFQDAGPVGHINMDSGHGPWPEGMMSFAGFMSKL